MIIKKIEVIKATSNENSLYILLSMSMLYVAFKLTCNTIFFRQILFHVPLTNVVLRLVSSSFIYPAIYVISDAIVAISNRKLAIIIILLGIFCDGLFSFLTFYMTTLQLPTMEINQQINSSYINHLGSQVWSLYCHGLLATIFASIAEVIMFNLIFKKSSSFFISTLISVIITLVAHNTITNYPMLKGDPEAWRIIFNGLSINISIMTIYAIVVSIILYLIKALKIIKKYKL